MVLPSGGRRLERRRYGAEFKIPLLRTAVFRTGIRDTWWSEHLNWEGRRLQEIIYLANVEFDCLLDFLSFVCSG